MENISQEADGAEGLSPKALIGSNIIRSGSLCNQRLGVVAAWRSDPKTLPLPICRVV